MKEYKPYYVWPNPAFPFRVFYDGANLRIFIIENLQHNYLWLSRIAPKIRDTDYFFVILGSHWGDNFLKNALEMFEALHLDKEKFFIMFNDDRDKELFEKHGFVGEIINQNAWLDYNSTMRIMHDLAKKKKYNAIYVGRLISLKRHYLASNVKGLAIVAGPLHGTNKEEPAPDCVYRNGSPLKPEAVCEKINQAYCGLILSEKEGACFASSEYLLCGVPVVSTISEGGRDVWYDDYNSIVLPPDPKCIADAVEEFVCFPRDPEIIRNNHISRSNYYRSVFVKNIARLFMKHAEPVDPMEYFKLNYFHKMRKSYAPDIDGLFS